MRLCSTEPVERLTPYLAAAAALLMAACSGTPPPRTVTITDVVVLSTPTVAPPVGTNRVSLLNSANDAFQRGDFTTASGLYERVINTPPTSEPRDVSGAIDDFARFRDMVSLLQQGRDGDAKAQLDALQSAHADSSLARLASQLWDQYGMIGSVRGACAQLQPQIASQAGPTLTALESMGVNVDAQTLCSVPAR